MESVTTLQFRRDRIQRVIFCIALPSVFTMAGCSAEGESLFSALGTDTELASATSQPETEDFNENEQTSAETDFLAADNLFNGKAETPQPEPVQSPLNPDTSMVDNENTGNSTLSFACDSPNMASAMLTLTNNARAQSRRCGGISYPAARALVWDEKLEAAATVHNNDMINNNFFDHTGSNGLSVGHRVTAQGFNWSALGENIAAGQRDTESATNDWLGSAGHCQNIMSGNFSRMAVACRVDPQSDFGIYWTAVYAR